MKLEDLIPIGTQISIDTGVKVIGYDNGCVILESTSGRGIRIMEAAVFISIYAKQKGLYSDGYLLKNKN